MPRSVHAGTAPSRAKRTGAFSWVEGRVSWGAEEAITYHAEQTGRCARHDRRYRRQRTTRDGTPSSAQLGSTSRRWRRRRRRAVRKSDGRARRRPRRRRRWRRRGREEGTHSRRHRVRVVRRGEQLRRVRQRRQDGRRRQTRRRRYAR